MAKEHVETIKKLLSSGMARMEIADSLGLTYDSVCHTIRRYPQDFKDIDNKPDVSYNVKENVSSNIEAQRERARRQLELNELRSLTNKRASILEFKEAIQTAALTIDPPDLIPFVANSKKFDDEVAVLVIGDVHVGQHTPARINGGNEHTLETTKQQFNVLTHKLLQAWEIQSKSILWKELVLVDVGDDVEGSNMRESQHRIVDPLVTQQTALYGRLLANLISSVMQVFPKIRVERISGNHGRTTQKAGNGGLSTTDPIDSYDWLAGQFAEEILRIAIDDKRVQFINHEGYWGSTDILGHKVVFEHGASYKSGSYGGIPFYAISKIASRMKEFEGDYTALVLGHYHLPYVLPQGYKSVIIGNGSFPATTPWVATTLRNIVRPSQTLFSINKDVGITMVKHLYLDV